jgi:hypothetical protein
MIQRLFKGDCSILRRNGTSWGAQHWREARYHETEPDYSTGSEVTSERWTDGKPVHVQTFIIPGIPNGGEYDTILIDINESVIEINGATEIDEKRKSIHSSSIEVRFCDNSALKVTNNTEREMQNTVITVKSATRMYSPDNPYAE